MVAVNDSLFRPCVGIMIVNTAGKVFVGSRLDHAHSGYWQMPQGGMEAGELPLKAAQRELEEETGISNINVLSEIDEWLYYEIPSSLQKKIWNGQYIGQRQKWFLCGFQGKDDDIQLDKHTHPEFGAWKWLSLRELVAHAVPFKRDVYTKVVNDFEPIIASWVHS